MYQKKLLKKTLKKKHEKGVLEEDQGNVNRNVNNWKKFLLCSNKHRDWQGTTTLNSECVVPLQGHRFCPWSFKAKTKWTELPKKVPFRAVNLFVRDCTMVMMMISFPLKTLNWTMRIDGEEQMKLNGSRPLSNPAPKGKTNCGQFAFRPGRS